MSVAPKIVLGLVLASLLGCASAPESAAPVADGKVSTAMPTYRPGQEVIFENDAMKQAKAKVFLAFKNRDGASEAARATSTDEVLKITAKGLGIAIPVGSRLKVVSYHPEDKILETTMIDGSQKGQTVWVMESTIHKP